jgi:glutamate synthase (NADPH) large chain
MKELYPFRGLPPAQGLYRPEHEHDACGIGFVASIEGKKTHDIVMKGIQILINLAHRGACGCDPQTGDGAGILIQIPHAYFDRETTALGFSLPSAGEYGVGMVFLPVDTHDRLICEGLIEKIAREEGLTILGWRDTPINGNTIGRLARGSQPYIEQIFLRGPAGMDQDALERKLYVVRKRVEAEVAATDMKDKEFFYIPSLSTRTIVYKGLLLAPQITDFYNRTDQRAVHGPPALFNQHVSQLEAGSPVPLHLP